MLYNNQGFLVFYSEIICEQILLYYFEFVIKALKKTKNIGTGGGVVA